MWKTISDFLTAIPICLPAGNNQIGCTSCYIIIPISNSDIHIFLKSIVILIWCNKKIPLTCMCKYLNMCAWNWFLIQLSFKLHLNTAFEEKKNNLCFLFDITYISDDRQRFISDINFNHNDYSFPHHINTIYMIHKKQCMLSTKSYMINSIPGL